MRSGWVALCGLLAGLLLALVSSCTTAVPEGGACTVVSRGEEPFCQGSKTVMACLDGTWKRVECPGVGGCSSTRSGAAQQCIMVLAAEDSGCDPRVQLSACTLDGQRLVSCESDCTLSGKRQVDCQEDGGRYTWRAPKACTGGCATFDDAGVATWVGCAP